ncbi:MAG: Holliday junction DNA helicase RuvA [Candidatus Shapirobacteria bacterium GW2011_GWE1_38_92]|uniref:Holliday junction branch migration complex subunit RuvA n=1 Tax=Candidatus Shapirobacteria bacterium GW2011_GWE1_38_92 TaxID=1618489 RepID=A0A0G0LT86_9BACT|nr:MAG: Holliday junction DNA helicase RuvA [Candidatus Shapirobacteria bacterium GW2011_GWE1_38_92]
MISSLTGKISKITGNNIEIEVSGVGYWLMVGEGFLKKHNEGEEVKVSLYGFDSWEELNLFKLLISVSGVGPRTAAGILGSKQSEEILKAIGDADVDFFEKLKGIGKKTAQRIIVDLKSKVGGLGELDLRKESTGDKEEDDIVLSLKQLGFDKKEIEKVVKKIPEKLETIEDKLSWCLRNME